jgi:hypothetical protein
MSLSNLARQGFGIALMVLFRISTGDAWGEIMNGAMLQVCTCTITGFKV